MPEYEIPYEILRLEKKGKVEEPDPEYRKVEKKYITTLKKCLFLEESAEEVALSQFNQSNVRLTYSGHGREFHVSKEVIEFSELFMHLQKIPCTYSEFILNHLLNFSYVLQDGSLHEIMLGIASGTLDKVSLMPTTEAISDIRIEGQVIRSKSGTVAVKTTCECFEYISNHQHLRYELKFKNNQKPFALQHQSPDFINYQNLFGCIISNEQFRSIESVSPAENDQYYFRYLTTH